MPNWCSNTLTLTHTDRELINRAAEAIQKDALFESLVSIGEWNYDTAVETWGTKWDVSNGEIIDRTDTTISMTFETAWAPPISFYNALVEQGFSVTADYFEPGMGFVGQYTDGEDEEYEIDPEDLSNIPEELMESYGIAEMYEDWDE